MSTKTSTKTTARPTPAQRAKATADRIASELTRIAAESAADEVAAKRAAKPKATRPAAEVKETARRSGKGVAELATTRTPKAKAVVTPAPVEQMDRLELLAAAKAEQAAVKAWKAAGSSGERPATPATDYMTATPRAQRTAKARKASTGTTTCRTPEQEAEVARIIVERRTAGDSWVKVAKALDEAKLPTRSGGQWWDATAHETARRMKLDVFGQAKDRRAAAEQAQQPAKAKRSRKAA
jgi:hypothetical protein